MTRELAAGIDVSTAQLRVRLLDVDSGELVGGAVADLPAVTGSGGVREQEVDFGALAAAVLDRGLAAVGGPARIGALAITATSGTVVPVDADGRIAGPAVMYNDARAAAVERSLRAADGRPASMLARIAALPSGTRPASVAQAIGTALVGRPVAGDTSHFLKAGIDPAGTAWPAALLAELGLDGSSLPELVRPGAALGEIAVGPAAGALLIAGMTDGCTSQLASGVVRPGEVVGVLGTTLVLKAVADADRWDAASGLYSHRAPDGRYWVGGASNVGGISLGAATGAQLAELDRAARALGPSAVVTYPLPRTGERFPVSDATLEPFAVDLAGRTTALPEDPAAAHRARLEGVALVERLARETLGVARGTGSVVIGGGATASALWNDLRAAAAGESVRIPAHADSGYGAAVLAAGAMLGGDFAAVVERFTTGGRTLDPDPALAAALDERYAILRAALTEKS